MSELETIQKQFQSAVMSSEQELPDFFVSTKKVSAEQRFEIYSEAYRLRLIECLEANYPILARHLGEDNFFELGMGYLYEYPSQHPSVRWFGDQLPEFIAETEKYGQNNFLIELAKLEWILTLVFDAADAPILSFADCAEIPPENWANLSFEFHPSLYRLDLEWNTVEIWEAYNQEKKRIPKPKKLAEEEAWIFWRKDLDVAFFPMNALEAEILDLAIEGKTWATLCETLLKNLNEEEVPNFIAPLLQRWLQQNLISLIKP
jgi:hypothetical protein